MTHSHPNSPATCNPACAPRKPGIFSRRCLHALLLAAIIAFLLFYSRTLQGML